MSKLAHAGDNKTISELISIALSIASSIEFWLIMFVKPFCFKFSSNRCAASPIKITVLACLLTYWQNSVKSVFLSLPPAINVKFLSLNALIATIDASGFVAFESL